MVTIVVHDWARSGDQLAHPANRVLGNYQARGGSSAPTPGRARRTFGTPQFLEAAFARMRLAESRGVVIVYSRRFYGARVGDQMSAWLGKNGEPERALMGWKGLAARRWSAC